MFVACFLTGPGTDKTPYNVQVSFLDILYYLLSSHRFLLRLGKKHNTDFLNNFYFIGVRICY